ncbi:putative acetolactate synthase large subunit [uncultured delta proteobacterium]|uniref:Putative acetolactate synthase large subunit n=1 Tax=uncultured delta proteobacterium TaxID=34034 RepID=A0A212JCZ0_9DELT|nr:putative acetolactate synthase large subunit [uncultured delta proteobacterium]
MALEKGIKGSEFLAKTLKGYGTTHVFLVEAILRRTMVELEKLGVRRIVAHSEKAAAYMADGYARVSRKVGVCFAQSVGAANLASGLQDAFLANAPVLAFTGQKPPMFQHRNAYQEIIHRPLFEPVTKYNVSLTEPGQLPLYLRQAFREATSGCPGPVHIDLPDNLGFFIDNSTIFEEPAAEESFMAAPSYRIPPCREDVAAAVKELMAAERPVIVAGGGAVFSGAGAEVTALAELLDIPVAVSVDGKGSIADNHPLSLGPVGNYARACANEIVSQADLVLYVGCGTGDQVTRNWTIPAKGTRIIQIDIDPLELGRNYPNTLGLLGDARLTLAAMAAAIGAKRSNAGSRAGWADQAARAVAAWRKSLEPLRASDAVPIRAERLCAELEKVLPEDAVLVSDTGFSAIWTAAMVDCNHPGQRYIRAAGGSLGWGYPAALGAKCAVGERPVICFTGDGAIWYHIAEMETAVRHNIATVTVLNNNGGFGQCLGGIRAAYGDGPGRKEDLYAFTPVNFSNLAREIGCNAVRAEKPADIGPAIRDALGSGRPSVVEVLTDIECSPWGG